MINLSRKDIKKARDQAYLDVGHNAYFGNGFDAGVKFVVDKLKDIKEKPINGNFYWIKHYEGTNWEVAQCIEDDLDRIFFFMKMIWIFLSNQYKIIVTNFF